MKPKVVEFVFDCYSKGKHRSFTDSVDGVTYTPRQLEQGFLAGEPEYVAESMLAEVIHPFVDQAGIPQEPFRVPLEPHEEVLARHLGRQLSEMSDEFEMSGNRRVSIPDGQTVIQFESRCKFVTSSDGNVDITIVRSGNSLSEQTVSWKTRDNTARDGLHYVKAEGSVSFLPHDTQKVIHVQLLSGHEDNCVNFKIDLHDSRNIAPVGTLNVNINDYKNLSPSDQSTIKHIIGARKPSVDYVINKLSANVTVETFKTALLFLCGNASSLPLEYRAAFDLLQYALPFAPREHLMSFVTRYFEKAPELEEMDIDIKDSGSDSASDEDSDID